MLAKKLSCPWVSTGEILRNHIGQDFKKDLAAGRLVGDETVLPLLEEELHKLHAETGEIIGDGWPRSIAQAKWLDERIKNGSIKLTAIVHLVMPKELARERVKMQGRADGNNEAVDKRFEEYQLAVLPALDYLKKLGYKVLEVEATGTIEEVEQKIDKTLGVAVANAA